MEWMDGMVWRRGREIAVSLWFGCFLRRGSGFSGLKACEKRPPDLPEQGGRAPHRRLRRVLEWRVARGGGRRGGAARARGWVAAGEVVRVATMCGISAETGEADRDGGHHADRGVEEATGRLCAATAGVEDLQAEWPSIGMPDHPGRRRPSQTISFVSPSVPARTSRLAWGSRVPRRHHL